MNDFYGLPIGILENDHIRLEYLTSCGPRIIRFSAKGGANMLAELPDFFLETTLGPFYFRGGHRLWRSPELMPDSYSPDNDGLVLDKLDDGIRLTQPPGTEIGKSVEIRLSPDRAALTLTHSVCNTGSRSVKLSPWAITMFRLGGTVILPQPVGNADPQGLLNNRILSIWPYTRINDPRLVLRDDHILIRANSGLPPIKIGYYNTHGWMAYWLEGFLFRKTFDIHPDGMYPDGGSNAESFCNDRFVELESLGPLKLLEPGSCTSLTETWELYESLNVFFIPKEIRDEINTISKYEAVNPGNQ
jgi:hypothetical protein